MISSRCFLSLTAVLIGGLTLYGFYALGAKESDFWAQSGVTRIALEMMLLLGLMLFWLKIFLRKRGRPVVLGSRTWLSMSALYIGILSVDLAVQGGILVSLPFDNLTFLIIYNGCILCHAGFWVLLFMRRRRAPDGAGGHHDRASTAKSEAVSVVGA